MCQKLVRRNVCGLFIACQNTVIVRMVVIAADPAVVQQGEG